MVGFKVAFSRFVFELSSKGVKIGFGFVFFYVHESAKRVCVLLEYFCFSEVVGLIILSCKRSVDVSDSAILVHAYIIILKHKILSKMRGIPSPPPPPPLYDTLMMHGLTYPSFLFMQLKQIVKHT